MNAKDGSADQYDIIVVGGGIFGLSVALEAARRGRATLLIERDRIPSPRSPSYGPSRKFRAAYRDPQYSSLAQEALLEWRRLESELRTDLFVPAESLDYSNTPDHPELQEREDAAREAGSHVALLSREGVRRRFPQFERARGGLLESEAGYLRATKCVTAMRHVAETQGVRFLTGQAVTGIDETGSSMTVWVGGDGFTAARVVIAAGGWSGQITAGLTALRQYRQGSVFVHGLPREFEMPALPLFFCIDTDYAGFPSEPDVGMKIGHHSLDDPVDDPDFDRAYLPEAFLSGVRQFLREDLGIVTDDYRVTYQSCMYNMSASGNFLLDFHPHSGNLFLATAGSGHGFKFGPVIGKVVLDRLDGLTSSRWDPLFSYDTFSTPVPARRPL